MRAGSAAALGVAALFVGACSTTPPDGGPEGASDPASLVALAARRDAALERFDRFRVRGGLGIWNDERSISARVDWRQHGDDLALALDAPLGLGSAQLVRQDGRTTLRRGDAPPLVGDSADTLLQRALGLDVPVPLGQLALWLRGLPGEAREVERDAAGRLRSLRWRDAAGNRWQARVLDYRALDGGADTVGAGGGASSDLDGLELPALLTARGAGYRLRLTLRDWVHEPAVPEDALPAIEPSRTAPRAPARLPVPNR